MINKNVKILSLAFLFIFLAYDGVQQYTTAFFSDLGMVEMGFRVLLIVYLFFAFFSPLVVPLASRFGLKRAMVFGSFFYALFIFSLVFGQELLIYFSASLLGIAAALLWMGQQSYLIRLSDKRFYGKNSGFLTLFFHLGATIGVLSFGVLTKFFNFEGASLLFGFFPLLGMFFLLRIDEVKILNPPSFGFFKKIITNIQALRIFSIWFVSRFVLGLIIGFLPLEIKEVLGTPHIGVLGSLFFVIPLILSYFWGNLSDKIGRNPMIFIFYILAGFSLILLFFSRQPLFLISGVFILALSYSIIRPVAPAFLGDISTKDNLESLTALSFMASSSGVLSSLFISLILQTKMIYLVSLGILFTSLLILIPVLKSDINHIRKNLEDV